ncbi:MAG: tyrosine-type recombinase/integrase, partial [Candidatus Geothermincolia bacterium]
FSINGETPIDQANARKAFLRALKAAGLRHVTMQSLRHSYATTLLSYGASIKAVQHALGHASATMTLNVYGHYIPAEIDHGALSKLGRQVAGSGQNVVEFPRLSNPKTP